MPTFTSEQIREISEQLDCGFLAFYHKQSGELIFVPNTDRYFDMETEAWQDDLDKLDKYFSEYQEIEAMDARESFRVMADFAEQVVDANLRAELIEVLNKPKPFRKFKFTIDNSAKYRQSWFAFKNNRNIEWTKDQIAMQQECEDYKKTSR